MPSEVRYSEVRKLLVSHGWTFSRTRGSHHKFTKQGEMPIIIPVHRQKVKYCYVREINKRLQEDC